MFNYYATKTLRALPIIFAVVLAILAVAPGCTTVRAGYVTRDYSGWEDGGQQSGAGLSVDLGDYFELSGAFTHDEESASTHVNRPYEEASARASSIALGTRLPLPAGFHIGAGLEYTIGRTEVDISYADQVQYDQNFRLLSPYAQIGWQEGLLHASYRWTVLGDSDPVLGARPSGDGHALLLGFRWGF